MVQVLVEVDEALLLSELLAPSQDESMAVAACPGQVTVSAPVALLVMVATSAPEAFLKSMVPAPVESALMTIE